jgi:hypothetical protein
MRKQQPGITLASRGQLGLLLHHGDAFQMPPHVIGHCKCIQCNPAPIISLTAAVYVHSRVMHAQTRGHANIPPGSRTRSVEISVFSTSSRSPFRILAWSRRRVCRLYFDLQSEFASSCMNRFIFVLSHPILLPCQRSTLPSTISAHSSSMVMDGQKGRAAATIMWMSTAGFASVLFVS